MKGTQTKEGKNLEWLRFAVNRRKFLETKWQKRSTPRVAKDNGTPKKEEGEESANAR